MTRLPTQAHARAVPCAPLSVRDANAKATVESREESEVPRQRETDAPGGLS